MLLFQSALARGKHEVPIYAYFVEVFDFLVGPSGLEPPTSCLSGTRSNLLSYDPMWLAVISFSLDLIEMMRIHSDTLSRITGNNYVVSPMHKLRLRGARSWHHSLYGT